MDDTSDLDRDLWDGLEAQAVEFEQAAARLGDRWTGEDIENPARYVRILLAMKQAEHAHWRQLGVAGEQRNGMTIGEYQRIVELCWTQGETEARLIAALQIMCDQVALARGAIRARLLPRATITYVLAQPRPAALLPPAIAADLPKDMYSGTGFVKLASGIWATSEVRYVPKSSDGAPRVFARGASPEPPDAIFFAFYPHMKPSPERLAAVERAFSGVAAQPAA